MKKTLAKLVAFSALTVAALFPVTNAEAVSYYPNYSCYYRDISGSCLYSQDSVPHFSHIYGNRRTYPFRTMFNAYANASRYNTGHYYEEDDDDNDYYDEDDDYYEQTRWYFDEDDDVIRPYRYQNGNSRSRHGYNHNYHRGNEYFEYEHTKVLCKGRDCATTQYRY